MAGSQAEQGLPGTSEEDPWFPALLQGLHHPSPLQVSPVQHHQTPEPLQEDTGQEEGEPHEDREEEEGRGREDPQGRNGEVEEGDTRGRSKKRCREAAPGWYGEALVTDDMMELGLAMLFLSCLPSPGTAN